MWRPSSLNICLWPQKILKLSMKLTPFIPQDLYSHAFRPSSRENMFVPLAGSGQLMNDWTSSILSVSMSLVKSFLRSSDCSFRISFFPTWMIIRFAVLCFIRMFRSSLFTSETVAWGKQLVIVVLLLIFLIIESPTIRVLYYSSLVLFVIWILWRVIPLLLYYKPDFRCFHFWICDLVVTFYKKI